MNIGEKIKLARKEKGIGQDALAEQLGLSVQAVSKWECNLSCPDIALLPAIADYLEVTLDYLLRDEQNEKGANTDTLPDLPDDDTFRIVQCIGRKVVSQDKWKHSKQTEKIPLYFDKTWKNSGKELTLNVEIWGNADIDGNISGNVTAGYSINCDNVGGNATAGNSVNCDCIGNSATAGTSINCDNVGNNVTAGTSVNCDSVGNGVVAGNSVTCDDIHGDVRCEGEVHCITINGNCEGEIHCETLNGNVTGGTINLFDENADKND